MLFRKKHPRACEYCSYGTKLNDEQILCVKRGIRGNDAVCRRFSYDPCKRIPPKPKNPDFMKFEPENFTL